MPTESAIMRLAKMLQYAEEGRGLSDGERENATKLALEFAKKNQIDIAVAMAKKGTDRPAKEHKDRFPIPIKRPLMQQMSLATHVFRFAGCQVLRFGKGASLRVVAFGFQSDIDTGRMLFASLVVQGERRCASEWKAHVDNAPLCGKEKPRTFRRGFYERYADEIFWRLDAISRAAEKAAEVDAPGTAIAIRSKDDEMKAWIAEMFGTLGKARKQSSTRLSSAGRSAGARAGREADLGQSTLSKERPGIEG
jgi:hypothetical protein